MFFPDLWLCQRPETSQFQGPIQASPAAGGVLFSPLKVKLRLRANGLGSHSSGCRHRDLGVAFGDGHVRVPLVGTGKPAVRAWKRRSRCSVQMILRTVLFWMILPRNMIQVFHPGVLFIHVWVETSHVYRESPSGFGGLVVYNSCSFPAIGSPR